ncbi:MAG: antitoxin [Wenzhouxiangellaceae bacterium]
MIYIMIRTQIQLPDELYREAKRIAAEQEISLAEVLRRGLEHMQRIYPPRPDQRPWRPPAPISLGAFQAPEDDWRELANS